MPITRLDLADVVVQLREADLVAARASGARSWIAYAVQALREATEMQSAEAGKAAQGTGKQ